MALSHCLRLYCDERWERWVKTAEMLLRKRSVCLTLRCREKKKWNAVCPTLTLNEQSPAAWHVAEWHGVHTVLPATHTFIHEWNEPSCIHFVSIHQMASPELALGEPFPPGVQWWIMENEVRPVVRVSNYWPGLILWHWCLGEWKDIWSTRPYSTHPSRCSTGTHGGEETNPLWRYSPYSPRRTAVGWK